MGGRVRLYTSLQQREQAVWTSKIRYKEVGILCVGNVSLWAHWIHSFHMHLRYLGQILFPCSPEGVPDGCFLHSLHPSTSAISVGVEAFGGLQFGELSFTFGGQKSLMAVTFLVYWYGRRYFHFTVPLHGYKCDHNLETFHDPFFCPTALEGTS